MACGGNILKKKKKNPMTKILVPRQTNLLEDKARRQRMSVDAGGAVGTGPEPTVLPAFHRVQEELTNL